MNEIWTKWDFPYGKYALKLYEWNMTSVKCPPFCSIQRLALFKTFSITLHNVSGCKRRILSRIFCFSCRMVSGLLTYALSFKYPHKKSQAQLNQANEVAMENQNQTLFKNFMQDLNWLPSGVRSCSILLKSQIKILLHLWPQKFFDHGYVRSTGNHFWCFILKQYKQLSHCHQCEYFGVYLFQGDRELHPVLPNDWPSF